MTASMLICWLTDCWVYHLGDLKVGQETFAYAVFEEAFRDFGLPNTIRTDNGVPFSSPNALFGLVGQCRITLLSSR
jgi:hypothetical protein